MARFVGARSFRSAFFAWALTRALVFALFLLTPQLERVTTGSFEATRGTHFSLAKLPVARLLRQTLIVADTNWYLSIAERGYEQADFNAERPHNWAFFPLFPLLWRLAARLTGEFPLTGILLVNLLLLAALYVLHLTVEALGFDPPVADRTVFYMAAFPVSYFFSLPGTEALFLLLTAGAFCAGQHGRWGTAGVLGALASATRVTGVILLPALLLLYWQRERRIWPPTRYLSLLLIPAGLLAFMCQLYVLTGNALAFKDVQVSWGRTPEFFLLPLFHYLREPLVIASAWDFRLLNFVAAAFVLACGLVLVRRRAWALAFFTLASLFVSLSSGLLQSQARYAMGVFPVFIVLAVATTRRPRLDETLRVASLILLSLLTILFSMHFTIAMS